MSTRIASPTTASAAATTITISANSCPSRFCSCRENATSVRLTAFSISSMQTRTTTGLWRIMTPIAPSTKRIAATIRNQLTGIDPTEPTETWPGSAASSAASGTGSLPSRFRFRRADRLLRSGLGGRVRTFGRRRLLGRAVPARQLLGSPLTRPVGRCHPALGTGGPAAARDLAAAAQVDRADGRDDEQDRGQLERVEERPEQAGADRLHGAEHVEVRLLGRPPRDAREQRGDEPEQHDAGESRDHPVEPSQAPGAALAHRAEQRHDEQEQDHDRPGVDDELDDEHELRREQQEHRPERDHHDDEAEHGLDRLPHRDHADASEDRDDGHDPEDDLNAHAQPIRRGSCWSGFRAGSARPAATGGSSSMSFVYTNRSRLTSDSSYSGPSTIACTGHASSQYPQKMQRSMLIS